MVKKTAAEKTAAAKAELARIMGDAPVAVAETETEVPATPEITAPETPAAPAPQAAPVPSVVKTVPGKIIASSKEGAIFEADPLAGRDRAFRLRLLPKTGRKACLADKPGKDGYEAIPDGEKLPAELDLPPVGAKVVAFIVCPRPVKDLGLRKAIGWNFAGDLEVARSEKAAARKARWEASEAAAADRRAKAATDYAGSRFAVGNLGVPQASSYAPKARHRVRNLDPKPGRQERSEARAKKGGEKGRK